ncbi:protein NAR1-like isoform X2 [Lycium barbarum]|uniref:protein NAR1-like isoform X2 n=1 Tax=Lycium barbarum TaxID=112863 RepID=UPI00293F23EF|nr:protein NAR1-like isoform X2 [Lycium barbarum]XP_060208379.1 protein NAR1-like isoform X2 [Lycium barbarum]XP_060208380.1 protein NAR1-like isoform X2 [Lycium barbarum]
MMWTKLIWPIELLLTTFELCLLPLLMVLAQNVGKAGALSKPVQKEEPVKISLKDCLACSGCITSAETVMLEKQSLDEFLSNLEKGRTVIVSISPQSRASLAVHYGLSSLQVFRKLTTLFKSLGVKAIFDTSCSRDLTLIESCNEFMVRYKQSQGTSSGESKPPLPMISSACPGWICYAEKTLGSYILPYISSVKSPQQTIGTVVKNYICQKLSVRPEDVYHVTVMPCYDKKLEAAREDFVFQVDTDSEKIMEVDSVLTTGEVLDLMQLKAVDFKSMEESNLFANIDEEGHLYGVHGSSVGYPATIYRHVAKVLLDLEVKGPIEFKTIRNSDFQEVSLEVNDKSVLKFALCYGFRNLQNVVRKLKMGKCDYHFLEIMACPSGCLNGGGQIKPQPGQSGKELIQLLETAYVENVVVADPFNNPIIKGLYSEWLEQPGSEKAKKYLHTEYHPVVKSITSQLQN